MSRRQLAILLFVDTVLPQHTFLTSRPYIMATFLYYMKSVWSSNLSYYPIVLFKLLLLFYDLVFCLACYNVGTRNIILYFSGYFCIFVEF